jgi:hypothetical protein
MTDFIPNRLLKTTKQERDLLRSDSLAYQIFIEEEKEKISESFTYFLDNYGVNPATASGSAPTALQMWPYQPEMAKVLESGIDAICLKSRRVGWTLISVHFLVWTTAFRKDTPGAKCIAISKNQRDANELIDTAKLIINSLPDYLRPAIGAEAKNKHGKRERETTSMISFPERDGANIRSLPSSSSSARGYTATVLFLDEIAFFDNAEELFVAAAPVVEGGGQLIIGSSGNGRFSRGKLFFDLWTKAESEKIMEPIFVSWRDRKDRDDAWYLKTLKTMPSEDKMKQEYPASPDEAFSGQNDDLAFSSSAISAVEEKGRIFDQLTPNKDLIAKSGIEVGIDWGLNSAAAILIPLGGYGFYLVDELVSNTDDAETFSTRVLDLASKYADLYNIKIERVYYDAAGNQQMKSFARIAPPSIRLTGIPFNKYKKRSVEFIRLLLKRTKANEDICYLGVSQRAKETLAQLRDIKQKEDGSLEKGNDHSVDALIAAVAQSAVQWDKEQSQR